MNYFNKTKWWAIAVIALIVLNATTLTIFWVERKSNHDLPQKQENRGATASYLTKELAFNSIQQLQYNQLVLKHRQSTRQIRKEIRNAKDAFFELLSDSSITDDAIKAASKRVSDIEQQLDILTFNHFKEVRTICNAEQKKKFDSIIKNAVEMMGPQEPPPPMLRNDSMRNRDQQNEGDTRPDFPAQPRNGEQREPPPDRKRPPLPPSK